MTTHIFGNTPAVGGKKNVLICDTQPVAIEGLKWLIENSGDMHAIGAVSSLEAASELLTSSNAPAIHTIVVDKGLGVSEVMEWVRRLPETGQQISVVVWGAGINEGEALRLLQAGARGIVRRTSESGTLLACLRAVTAGGAWMEDGIFGSSDKLYNPRRSELTAREKEIVVLVEQGLRNRDIGRMLGIQTGTVKIHLKHIFEKTGVSGRYSLALTGLREKGAIPVTEAPQEMLV